MIHHSWPTLSFFKRTFLFYAVVWLGTGALAIFAICLWYRPADTFLFSGNALCTITYVEMIRRMGARRFVHRLSKGAHFIVRKVASLLETDLRAPVSGRPHSHA